MSIYIGKPIVVSDMQGPCPEGFHVPLYSEFQTLNTAMARLGGLSFVTYLKLPKSGRRILNSTTQNQGATGSYWCSNSSASGFAYNFQTDAGSGGMAVSWGATIRPFKNISVTPDSNWAVLYQGAGSAGVFYNSTLGLISISDDGTNWITIADKNVGATTVYNDGDTLSEANCGKYFQWGNNYGFAWTGTLTTSGTAVNAGTYGPGNYYSGSTWITTNPRDSSSNTNLRGGVSQGTSTVNKEPKNIYVRINVPDYTVQWKNRDNTILETDLNVMEGTAPTYNGATPTRSGYDFTGWSPTPAPIYSDTDYTAQFTKNPTPVTTKGIYWNSSQGIISWSSDGSTWKTMSDKNLGATTVWSNGSTLSEANCGKYYQWGNNYGFPFAGPTSTSTSQVNASNYGPNNYYNNSTFRYYYSAWDSSNNNNLWGGETGTNDAMRGPCASGYHIPSSFEMYALTQDFKTITGLSETDGSIFGIYFKLPLAGIIRYSDATVVYGLRLGRYWTATFAGSAAYCLNYYSTNVGMFTQTSAYGHSIRPFKNTAVQPDDSSSWTKIA